MRRRAAHVGNDSGRPGEERRPPRRGERRHEDLAGLKIFELLRAADHADRPGRATRRRWRARHQGAIRPNRTDQPRIGIPHPLQHRVHSTDEERWHEPGLLVSRRTAAGHVHVRRQASSAEGGERLGASQEEDVVGICHHGTVGERFADPHHRTSHSRPRDRQLAHLLLAQRDEVLGLGQEALEGPQTSR